MIKLAVEGGVVQRLRNLLGKSGQSDTGRLPPERQLSEALGISRTELRKALGVLEAEDQLWRHVGKGTFFGSRPSIISPMFQRWQDEPIQRR